MCLVVRAGLVTPGARDHHPSMQNLRQLGYEGLDRRLERPPGAGPSGLLPHAGRWGGPHLPSHPDCTLVDAGADGIEALRAENHHGHALSFSASSVLGGSTRFRLQISMFRSVAKVLAPRRRRRGDRARDPATGSCARLRTHARERIRRGIRRPSERQPRPRSRASGAD
jgi:hypothetical protein